MANSCDALKLSLELHEITCKAPRCTVSVEPLREFLTRALDYLDGKVDVVDGHDGQPRANEAMSLHTEAARLLRRLPGEAQRREWAQTEVGE